MGYLKVMWVLEGYSDEEEYVSCQGDINPDSESGEEN